jgi:phosphomethylpyrimidine synthase
MVEGPGHMPLDQIEMNMKLMKRVCHEAPFYVLGPLVTDSAPGYDHLVGAIGGTVAAIHGADFLCYVTPAEHLCLPDVEVVKEGVIASKLAAHCADVVKGTPGARQQDYEMSQARRQLNWEKMYAHALFPDIARQRKEASESSHEDFCSMCGNLCAVKNDRND